MAAALSSAQLATAPAGSVLASLRRDRRRRKSSRICWKSRARPATSSRSHTSDGSIRAAVPCAQSSPSLPPRSVKALVSFCALIPASRDSRARPTEPSMSNRWATSAAIFSGAPACAKPARNLADCCRASAASRLSLATDNSCTPLASSPMMRDGGAVLAPVRSKSAIWPRMAEAVRSNSIRRAASGIFALSSWAHRAPMSNRRSAATNAPATCASSTPSSSASSNG